MSLRLKIAASMAALAGIIAALAATGAYLTAARQLDSGIDDTLISRAEAAVAHPGPGDGRNRPGYDDNDDDDDDRDGDGPGGYRGAARCPDMADLQGFEAAQILKDDRVVACITGGRAISPTEMDWAIAGGDDAGTTSRDGSPAYHLRTAEVDGEEARVITMAFPQGGAVQLARETAEARHVLAGLSVRLLAIALTGIALAAIVGFLLAERIVRPIRRLTTTAEHIAATRDLTTPIPTAGSDEIGSLSASFSTMVGSLAESQEQQQRLISDASHEMRTPLTSLRTNLELLERAERSGAATLSAEDRRAVIDDLQFETSELTSLLTELVELATDRSSGDPLEVVDLADLCRGVAERAQRRTGREIVVHETTAGASRQSVEVRQHMIERAVANLIDNAVKYSPDGTTVTAIVSDTRVEVRDGGLGIAAEDLPRVFDRFFRATEARTAPGSGLGLAIVKQIVEAHGGTVFAGNHDGGGAAVGFELNPGPTAIR